MLNDESNQSSKFKTRNWVEINDESRGTYTINDIKFKTTMLRANLYDYADAYILVKGTITITGASADDDTKQLDERNKGVIFKNCAPFTNCISRINNRDIDNAQESLSDFLRLSTNFNFAFLSLLVLKFRKRKLILFLFSFFFSHYFFKQELDINEYRLKTLQKFPFFLS